jgi:von Willebrand factor A domain-containing protein 8
VQYNNPPKNKKERLKIALKIQANAQYASSGDTTIEATEWAIKQSALMEADERFVFVFSDANLDMYGFNPDRYDL